MNNLPTPQHIRLFPARRSASLAIALWISFIPMGWAKDAPPGGLIFLGTTADGTRSVWLSATGVGDFRLEAPGQQVVDEWARARRGLRLSLSPVVSQGNGSPHTLFEIIGGNAIEIGKQNQQGGITFPSHLERPPTLPPFLRPPTGVMPGMPIDIAPPIATLPQTPTPPIGTLPPNGTMPTRPQLPGGAKPPIATLPQTPTPPIGTLPPNGTMPARPALPDGAAPPIGLPSEPGSDVVPITRGRDLLLTRRWNLWSDARYGSVSDRRNGMDVDGETSYLTLGADRRFNADLVMGLTASYERSRTTSFDRNLRNDSDGFTAGPYFGYRITNVWALDGSLAFGRSSNESRVAELDARYDSDRYSAALGLTGQFAPGELLVRPRLSISYSHYANEAHAMRGSLMGIPIELPIAANRTRYGSSEVTTEVSRELRASERAHHIAFVEAGLRYAFDRPDDGRILTSQLAQVATSAWAGSIRAGLRSLISDTMLIETTGSYLSIGEPRLNEWELRLFLSHGF
jgi:hypothetical protein